MKKSVCLMFLGMLLLPQVSHAVPLTAEHLYTFARQKNEKLLDKYSKHIDITNKNNDTALCISVRRRDRDSFELLKDYGASTKVDCLQKILKQSVVKQDNTSAVVSDSDGEFLGMGLKGWGLTGLVVAGVAAASGGGGGGGSGEDNTIGKYNKETNNGEIVLKNNSNKDVYGMKNDTQEQMYNASKESGSGYISANINVEKNGDDGDAYGMYSKEGEIFNAYGKNSYSGNATIVGNIRVENYGNTSSYGLYSSQGVAVNGFSDGNSANIHVEGKISMINHGSGSSFGIRGKNVVNNPNDTINIVNLSSGHAYGMFGDEVFNSGEVNIYNIGSGYATGINGDDVENYGNILIMPDSYTDDKLTDTTSDDVTYKGKTTSNSAAYGIDAGSYNSNGRVVNEGIIGIAGSRSATGIDIYRYNSEFKDVIYNNGAILLTDNNSSRGINVGGKHEVYNEGNIDIKNSEFGYGIKASGEGEIINSGSIKMDNVKSAIGIDANKNHNISNEKNIIIKNSEYAKGIHATGGGRVINSGLILIDKAKSASGIHAFTTNDEELVVINQGTIQITNSEYGTGISASGKNTIVANTGTIRFNNQSCYGNGCKNNSKAISLTNGASFVNMGTLSAQNIALNDFGGEIIANSNSKFVAEDKISGDLSVSADVVQNGFDKTYTSKDAISAKDVDGLNLSSKSALFEAKLENDSDIVMEMKEFGDVVEDKSVAGFLSDNYSNQNNEKLFNNLKGIENTKALNSALSDMTGKEMFNRLAFEDLTMAREFNFDLNNKLFNNKEENLTTSGSISPWMFSGASDSQTRYSLNNMTIGNNTIGLAVALTDVNTNDGNGKNTRNDKMYQMAMPVGYSAYGFDFITTPSVGYSYGTYNRVGFDNTNYKGTLEKQTFGLMNEARYPFMMAGWNLNLALEFNVIGYRISGDEGSKEFGLNIAKQDSFSVEAGFGMYANKDIDISKDSKLKLYNGVAFYKEFANPYKMKVGMNGMSSTYTLRDENRGKNRAVVRTGFDYTSQDLSLYGSLSSYIDNELQTNADIGLKYSF